ncbi:TPA: type II toxin-antitoxin system RelE/ParE family toxin [Pseudomonas aeruginosa]|uniref:type II toxin-antitoxin system RelE/ParE family toxin n=1 Tax=Pseudomonas aeruginosa TaxID=287 RepID=UPI0022DD2CE5|nr:type II toxin-antitoxin system RelE/ParE family toxin [Pseudomonas aeruginosa]WBI87411.1 hypothetical protein PALA37_03071 [Pseudomonas aeruginosa]HBP5603927.1 type II toxin-antitoxin system RelE/ParE family toxin [Pseudomonas aeruginosa]
MKVYWTSEAEQDRSDIWEFIAADDLAAAVRLDERFSATTHQLANFPELGTPGNVSGTREFIPHGSYRLVYQIDEDAIWILALVHTSMMWPPL